MPGLMARQEGFTLIEILVAVLVLSLGLIGMAALQTQSLRFSQDAYLRSQAMVVAQDIADRVRANPSAAANGAYDAIDTDNLPIDPACSGTASGCTPAQLAAHDIRDWAAESLSMLPAGSRATVTRSGNIYTVEISWTGMDEGGAVNAQYVVNFGMPI